MTKKNSYASNIFKWKTDRSISVYVRWLEKRNIFRFHEINLLVLNVFIYFEKSDAVESFYMYIIKRKFLSSQYILF